MKILVTGNCGFIGQNFVRMFKDEHKIVGIDKMGYASDNKALGLCPTYRIELGLGSTQLLIDQTVKSIKPDVILNCAAESHVDNSIKSPECFMYSNFIGTYQLLEAARKANVPKFIQVGTDEELGDLNEGDPPFSNPHLLKPSSPYSASKAGASLLALAYKRTFGLNIIITRSCNNYGEFQHKEKLIPVIIRKAIHSEKIPIYGTGMNMREWIHVRDNCRALMAIIEGGCSGEIYNIGSGVEFRNIDLAFIILDKMNKNRDRIQMVEDRKGHDFRYCMNSSKTYTLGWSPKINIDSGLDRTIKWFEQNYDYWENV
jgi:dTDP-glucose 4,6-dehydratase